MQSIGDYALLIKLVLSESAKYFTVLLLGLLTIRLWRRLPRVSGRNRMQTLLLAGLVTAVAAGIGGLAMAHSLSLLYSAYGMKAFNAGNLQPALSLFHTSSGYWKRADTYGQAGICLLLLDQPGPGRALLADARSMRHGDGNNFEQFYEGLYDFLHGQPDQAAPLLAASTADLYYRWNATKLLAVIELEKNRPAEAEQLMRPYLQAEVRELDQAYVVAALDLAAGKKADARALLDKFSGPGLSPFWKPRFAKLRAQTQD